MRSHPRRPTLALAVLAGMGIAPAPAQDTRTNIGILTCTSRDGGAGDNAQEETRPILCGFKPTLSGAEQRYSGTMRGRSAEGAAGKRVWVWAVFGPSTTKVSPDALAQTYSAARPPAGGSLPELVGDTNGAISLQPETADGATAATQVELKLLTTPA